MGWPRKLFLSTVFSVGESNSAKSSPQQLTCVDCGDIIAGSFYVERVYYTY